MIQLPTTEEVISVADRYESASDFFSVLGPCFDSCRSQVLKVETRQHYTEDGNLSYIAMMAGNWKEALRLLPESRSEDIELYQDLTKRGVDFLRCHPIQFPLSDYCRWEMEVYDFNSSCGERIFCCNYDSVRELLSENIKHDFMVFDARHAFVHDYDELGNLIGGWSTTDLQSVIKLQTLFIFLRSLSQPYTLFR